MIGRCKTSGSLSLLPVLAAVTFIFAAIAQSEAAARQEKLPDPAQVASRICKLFQGYDRFWTAGQCVEALKKEGYKVSEISYGQFYDQEFDIELTGRQDVTITCGVGNDRTNEGIVRELGISNGAVERDNFLWKPGKGFKPHYNSSETMPGPKAQANMDRLMESLLVTRLTVRLPGPGSRSDSASDYKPYGTAIVKALESRLGRPNSKSFDPDLDGWVVEWKNKRVSLWYGPGEGGTNAELAMRSIRFRYQMRDSSGSHYTVSIFSGNESIEPAKPGDGYDEGDMSAAGYYKASLLKEGWSEPQVQSVPLFEGGQYKGEFNLNRNMAFVIQSRTKGQPDILVVEQYSDSSTSAATAFFVKDAKLTPITFKPQDGKPMGSIGYSPWHAETKLACTGPFKFHSANYFNVEGEYHHSFWDFDPAKGVFAESKSYMSSSCLDRLILLLGSSRKLSPHLAARLGGSIFREVNMISRYMIAGSVVLSLMLAADGSSSVIAAAKSAGTASGRNGSGQSISIELTIPGQAKFSVPPGWAMLNEFDKPIQTVPLDQRGFFNKVDANIQEQSGKGVLTSVQMTFEFDASYEAKPQVDDFCRGIVEDWKSGAREYAKSSAEYLKTKVAESQFFEKQVTLKTPGGSTRQATLYVYHCKGADKLWHTSGLLIVRGDRSKLRSELGYYENAYRYPLYTIELGTLKDWWDQDKAAIEKTITSLVAP